MRSTSMEEARERAGRALRGQWEAGEVESPEQYEHFIIEFDCTHETFLEILAKVKSYETSNRKYRNLSRTTCRGGASWGNGSSSTTTGETT